MGKINLPFYGIVFSGVLLVLQACGGGGSETPPPPEVDEPVEVRKIELSMGLIQPEFSPNIFNYTAELSYDASQIRVRALLNGSGSVTINGETLGSLESTTPIFLNEGETQLEVITQPLDNSTPITYTLTLNRQPQEAFTQSAYLKASRTGQAQFGTSSAIDGNTLVVGASSEDSDSIGVVAEQTGSGSPDSGAVYIFVYDNGEWQQQAFIKASNADDEDFFGKKVAISGDTLVVSAIGEDSSSNETNGDESDNSLLSSGAVYVFERTATTWQQTAHLKASNAQLGNLFGSDIDIDGDTLVVVSPGDSNSNSGVNPGEFNDEALKSGAAYVFSKVNESWQQQAYIKSSYPDRFDQFGSDVSISGDTILVSAPNESSSATGVDGEQESNLSPSSGAAYVFERNGTDWSQSAYIKA